MAACKFNIIVRAFSSSTAQNQMVKTPVQVFGIGGRYATALYSAAVKAKEVDAIEKELMGVQKAIRDDKKFRDFIKDPTIKRSIKSNALEAASKKYNLSKSTTNALKLIAENGRLKNFDQIVTAYRTIMAAHRGDIECEVTSAEPLDEVAMKQIESAIKEFAKGKNILLSTKVDPSLIGGLTLTIGDKFADMSISSKLKKYSAIIKSSV
ncbi:UNVERIFIED_CONTAM: hypothetical protein PYX00_003248 [Menopon gallinae]|uniref:Oligomycin sensitivity conferral protein n=1 Tax=Menopon gallinae TaxID=328185 RepID=A0AAW2HZ66_9NEOP